MINLLPVGIKDRSKVYSRVYTLTVIYLVILLSIGAGAAFLLSYNLTKNIVIGEKENQLAQINTKKDSNTDIVGKSALIEDRITSSATMHESKNWDEFIGQIGADTPTDVQITSMKVDQGTTKILTLSITGTSNERRSVILYRDKLAQDKQLTTVELTALTEATTDKSKSFTFTITASINDKVANAN